MTDKPKPKGWYLGLPYLKGAGGLTANGTDPVPDNLKPVKNLFSATLLDTPNWKELLANWWDCLVEGGHLVLWSPDIRHIENPVRVTRDDIMACFSSLEGWTCHEDDLIDGYHFCVFQKTGKKDYRPWRKKQKHCIIFRPGAIGDALMASSVFPGLVEQGFAVDFAAHPNGCEAVQNDPFLTRVISTDSGATPDNEIPAFWKAWSERYDMAINLNQSVEGALLTQHWRSEFHWPEDQRRRVFTGSYLESTHRISGVPGPYKVKFYPTQDEIAWANNKAESVGDFILWCLRGSAVHKWYPWAPQAVCQVLVNNPGIKIVLSGDEHSKALEAAIVESVKDFLGDTSRLRSMVGTGSVRHSMEVAKLAKVVVGPETGVMNAVCLEPVMKVCLLSHSSPSNLTGDWVNTIAIESPGCRVSKGPCHQLHHGHDFCPQHKVTGAAECATAITPDRVAAAVKAALNA